MVEFRALRCAHCQTFQVLQVTKSPKWKCKLCGEKQSILKEYGRGTGAECRQHVQKLNNLRMKMDTVAENSRLDLACVGSSSSSVCNAPQNDSEAQGDCLTEKQKPSRWETFLEKDEKGGGDGDRVDKGKGVNGSYLAHDEVDEEGICVTTDWSAFQNKRREAWKTKRKMHQDRSKFQKIAKFGDGEEEDAFSSMDGTNMRNIRKNGSQLESTWKQTRVFSQKTNNPDFKGNHSKIISKFNDNSNLSTKLSGKHGVGESCSTYDHNVISGYSRDSSRDNNFDPLQRCFPKGINNLQDRPSSTVKNSVSKNESNSSFRKDKTAGQTMKQSKWNTFITKEDGDDTNDSDDEDAYQSFTNYNRYNSDNTEDSLKLSSMQRFDECSGLHNSTAKWSSFLTEKDSDNSSGLQGDEDDYEDQNLFHNQSNDLHIGEDVTTDCNRMLTCVEIPSQSDMKENIDCSEKSKHSYGARDTDCTKLFSECNTPSGVNKTSLFEIGDGEDLDVWDLDL